MQNQESRVQRSQMVADMSHGLPDLVARRLRSNAVERRLFNLRPH